MNEQDFTKDSSLSTEINQQILVLALKNAVKHKGKANPGALTGAILGSFPDLKSDMKILMMSINSIVSKVNNYENQEELLLKLEPNALEKKEHKQDLFGFLK